MPTMAPTWLCQSLLLVGLRALPSQVVMAEVARVAAMQGVLRQEKWAQRRPHVRSQPLLQLVSSKFPLLWPPVDARALQKACSPLQPRPSLKHLQLRCDLGQQLMGSARPLAAR